MSLNVSQSFVRSSLTSSWAALHRFFRQVLSRTTVLLLRLGALLLPAVLTCEATAETVRNCAVGSTDLMCRLSSVLHALYVVAFVLVALLGLVIVLAVRIYRRNRANSGGVL